MIQGGGPVNSLRIVFHLLGVCNSILQEKNE